MEAPKTELPPPPPGAIRALVHGFNTVAANVWVVALPLLLDIFLWLGPRFKPDALFAPLYEAVTQMQPSAQGAAAFIEMLNELSAGFNLFVVLRTYPLGVFSLMSASLVEQSPLGGRVGWVPAGGWLASFGAVAALTALGWFLGSLYYSVVASRLREIQFPGWGRALWQGGLLSLLWVFLFAVMNIPLFILMGVIALLGEPVQGVLTFLLSLPLALLLMTIFFASHGIFLRAQNAFASIASSFQLMRFGLPGMGWFTILAMLLSQGLDLLWRIPPAQSWLALAGILGHAFVSTSLLAASFIYYREMTAWVEEARLWLQNRKGSSARA
jgi:hypothetical protein